MSTLLSAAPFSSTFPSSPSLLASVSIFDGTSDETIGNFLAGQMVVLQGVDIVTLGVGSTGSIFLRLTPGAIAFCRFNVGSDQDWLTYRGAVPIEPESTVRIDNESGGTIDVVAWGYTTSLQAP